MCKEIHIPKAENTRADSEQKALINCLDKINKAKGDGELSCYISARKKEVTKNIITKLINAGYDIHYQHYNHNKILFVTVDWVDGCSGRIYDEESGEFVDVDTMFTCGEGSNFMSKKTVRKEIHIPKAENTRNDAEPTALIKCLDAINKAKVNGHFCCYISAGSGDSISKNIILQLIDASYDIYYKHFIHSGSWFIKADWVDGCSGRIFNEETRKLVDIDTMFTY